MRNKDGHMRYMMLEAAAREFVRKCDAGEARSTRSYAQFKEALAEPVGLEGEPSATACMNIAQRILHVGGRNPPGSTMVEFGSIQAVEALVRQVLRDLPPGSAVQLEDLMNDLCIERMGADELRSALSRLELAANTVNGAYIRNPGRFAEALRALEDEAKAARALLGKHAEKVSQ